MVATHRTLFMDLNDTEVRKFRSVPIFVCMIKIDSVNNLVLVLQR